MEQIRAACEADRDGKYQAAVELYVAGLERLVQQHGTDPSLTTVIEQHTARLEALVGEMQLQSTTGVAANGRTPTGVPEPLWPGQHVYYESTTAGGWIEGKVLRVHADGSVSLDVRARADRRRIRTTRPGTDGNCTTAPAGAIDATVRKYYETHQLAHTDKLCDGFFDGGRGRALCPLAQLRAAPVDEKREVIVADKTADQALARYAERAASSIAPLRDRESQVLALSLLVISLMGGHRGEAIEVECHEQLRHLKRRLETNVIPLGMITVGCCRHRALLFKYLADGIGLPTRLLRGAWSDCEIEAARERTDGVKSESHELAHSGHAWNAVFLESPSTDTGAGAAAGHWRVVDCMLEPGAALLPSSSSAVHYSRRIGAASIARRRLPVTSDDVSRRVYGGAGCSSIGGRDPPSRQALAKRHSGTAEEAEAPPPGAFGFESEVIFNSPRIQLGSGSFGTVFKARWRGLEVAVKEVSLLDNESTVVKSWQTEPTAVQTAMAEVNTMAHLPKHVNLCQYFGSYLGSSDAAAACDFKGTSSVMLHLVLEFCGGGTLFAALHGAAAPSLNMLQRARIVVGVAEGLAALHEHRPAILHQDLSTNNILLTTDGVPKLADFGLARLRARSESFRTQHVRGTPHYMAPEVWDGNHLTDRVDVYALAMVMLEVWTVEIPWASYRVPQIGGSVARGERPQAASRLPASYGRLVAQCWAQLPSARPTARHIATELAQRYNALRALASYGATNFSDVSTSVLHTLLQTLGHSADSARPSQVQRAASFALRLEGLCDCE